MAINYIDSDHMAIITANKPQTKSWKLAIDRSLSDAYPARTIAYHKGNHYLIFSVDDLGSEPVCVSDLTFHKCPKITLFNHPKKLEALPQSDAPKKKIELERW